MEGVGLGLARAIVQRYALKTGSEQGFGVGDKVAHDCVDRPDDAAFVECIISEQPAIMPRPIWPVLVPWSSLPAVPFCAKTGMQSGITLHMSNRRGAKRRGYRQAHSPTVGSM